MKRFSFKLEKVQKLRKFTEEQAKIELGRAIGVLSGIEDEIKTIGLERNSAANRRFSGVSGGADITAGGGHEMIVWDNYIARLDLEIEQLLQKAAEAELVVEEKRRIYIDASRELKIMEKLREKQEQEYRKEYFAEQTRELDDLRRIRAGGAGA
jgi:flagellar FliJ protein